MGPTRQQCPPTLNRGTNLAEIPQSNQPSAPLGPGLPPPASAPAAALHRPARPLTDRGRPPLPPPPGPVPARRAPAAGRPRAPAAGLRSRRPSAPSPHVQLKRGAAAARARSSLGSTRPRPAAALPLLEHGLERRRRLSSAGARPGAQAAIPAVCSLSPGLAVPAVCSAPSPRAIAPELPLLASASHQVSSKLFLPFELNFNTIDLRSDYVHYPVK